VAAKVANPRAWKALGGFGIKGQLYAGVPKQMLDHLRVYAASQKQGGARVPEVVPADRGEACAVEERLEVAVHSAFQCA
jgi:hypothetical protein